MKCRSALGTNGHPNKTIQERSPNMVRVIKSTRLRWAGHIARMEESSNIFRILTGTTPGKRPLRRPRRRWGENTSKV